MNSRTLTTPVRLDKCFKSIKQHAFVKSSYPVIVTLEDHLTPSLREKVAEMAIEIFGELLYYPEPGVYDEFPSPRALKHQIVLSTKPPKEYLDSAKESLEFKKEKVKNVLKTKLISGEDLLGKETPALTAEAETDEGSLHNNTDQDGDDDVNNNRRGQTSNCEMDDEEHGSDSHKSSKEHGPGFKRLYAMQSADLKVEPPNDVAEDCSTDTDLSSQLGETDEHAGLSTLDTHLLSQIKDSDEHAAPSNPSLDIQNSAQVKISDESAADLNSENSKSSPLGTPEYKRLLALQTNNVKDAEDLDVSTNRSKTGTTEHKHLGSLLDTYEWKEGKEEANEDEDVNKIHAKESVYKSLIAIHAEKPKDGLRKTFLVEADKVRRLSLSEQELERAAESYGTDIVRFTKKNLVRVYPKGTRVNSSNFEPLQGLFKLPRSVPEVLKDSCTGFAFNKTSGIAAIRTDNYCIQFYSLLDDREISEVQVCERNHQPVDEVTLEDKKGCKFSASHLLWS
ncbi:hypothetical protein POM88_020697 [Heracleum sosnowskyi]|uniref:Phosphoinositide phospholipase C n=1 Tax=Heracleum sosnowskyi TaxID=360622 RepID=A0AAD8IEF1_9APIA|nr:hypothetical protein POM88_020697 [Heracleum sosnowskyi]